jgi:nitroimidazol reductase NimA-like FMN-containing flavoprotein (pyridoxamine 5'-phosphate oxidase superfamily)
MLGQLNAQQSLKLLSSNAMGRLACTDGRMPYIVPVTYHFDGKYIYGQTNEGSGLAMLRKNPNVCFEVDTMSDMSNWQSVAVSGKFEELSNAEAARAGEKLFRSLFTLSRSTTRSIEEDGAKRDDTNTGKFIMYRIKVESMTGRCETR